MRYIKKFENVKHDYFFKKLKEELDLFGIENYTINSDETVDVEGDVNLNNKSLTEIPFIFGKVTGSFYCHDNKLKSLEGCPYYVGETFGCSSNILTDLKGSPKEVAGDFYCIDTNISSLEGMSMEIGGCFYCTRNINLKKLNSMSNIEGDIYCDALIDESEFEGYCREIVRI